MSRQDSPQDNPYQDRVVWSEGMFLRPQHLQQHDRYLDFQLRERVRLLSRHGWGVRRLQIDEHLLSQGVLALTQCEGLLPDGTLFRCASDQRDRLLREIPPGRQHMLVDLALPITLAGTDETDPNGEGDDSAMTRWRGLDADVQDSNLGSSKRVPLKVARPHFRLLLEDELSADYSRIAIARIKESHASGQIEYSRRLPSSLIPATMAFGGMSTCEVAPDPTSVT